MSESRISYLCKHYHEFTGGPIRGPDSTAYKICPLCGEPLQRLTLNGDVDRNDHILTMVEAGNLIRDFKAAQEAEAVAAGEAVLSQLRDDLDRWAREEPYWLRK